jgi:hypothetical protein
MGGVARLVRMVILLSISSALFIGVAWGGGQQITLKPEAFKAELKPVSHDSFFRIYLTEHAHGLQIDVTNWPCFGSTFFGGPAVTTNERQQAMLILNQFLLVERDSEGIYAMDVRSPLKCYFIR